MTRNDPAWSMGSPLVPGWGKLGCSVYNAKALTKKSQWYVYHSTYYHWIPFSINDISAGLGDTLNGNLKYHSIPLNGTKNPKYHSKNHSDTIQIPLAIIPPRTIQKQWYLNAIFCKGRHMKNATMIDDILYVRTVNPIRLCRLVIPTRLSLYIGAD